MHRTATCSCGQLSITLKGDPFRIHCCNCMECRKTTGSAFSTVAVWNDENVVSISGDYKAYTRSSESGRKVTWHFCPTCAGIVFHYAELFPGKIGVPIGGFGDMEFPRPAIAIWCRSKFSWLNFVNDISQSQQQTS
jgi:hypothetical protein